MVATRGARKPSRKSGLLPRSPLARRLPRLANIDFASGAIVEVLAAAGWNASVLAEHDLDRHIREIVVDYISDKSAERSNRVTLKELREGIAKFGRDIDKLISQAGSMPDASRSAIHSVMAEALNRELDELDQEGAPDLEYIRASLETLRAATRRVLADESGAGPPADRVGLTLVRAIATIFEKCTGKRASASPDGRFAGFVAAVNGRIPKAFQLERTDSLIVSAVKSLRLSTPILPSNCTLRKT
jgi:hypothetical protein